MTLEVGMQGIKKKRRYCAIISTLATLCVWAIAISAEATQAAPPQITATTVSAVTGSSATLEADINPQGNETLYHFEYGTKDCSTIPCTHVPSPEEAKIPVGSSPVRVKEAVKGLTPGTVYHLRVVVKSIGGKVSGRDRAFATLSAPQGGLPDGRAYEQASPIDKNGGDVTGEGGLVKAADDGGGITFGSTFGIPGGKGAQALPSYLAARGQGETGWATQGLLPPPVFGERAQVQGWLSDFSETFSNASKLGDPRTKALVAQSTVGGPATAIAPYTAKAEYSYVGASADASTVFFESQAKLAPKEGQSPIVAAIDGAPNLYAWDAARGELSLAGVLNNGKAPPRGAFAGPYGWSAGTSGKTLREGGAVRGYYLQGTHAITAAGDVYFTEASTGQLYLRENPTRPQSPLNGEDQCTDHSLACTIHISVSQKTDGKGPDGTDAVGPQPAAFQAASADASRVFFTSPEKLTNDANTGPEQPLAEIGLGNSASGKIENARFIPEHAIGVAVDGSHVYWADPAKGTIGRADLDGKPESIEPGFITPGPVDFETEPGVFEAVESSPRYVAVDAGHVYWTNTGRLDENGDPLDGGGTIGRAEIDGEGNPTDIKADFIRGASNPQGIAVNATRIYWANAGQGVTTTTIARAAIDGTGPESSFFKVDTSRFPYGVALSASYVYFGLNEEANDNGFLGRVPLEGGAMEILGIGKKGIRGVAVDATHVYWAAQGEEAIGRADLELTPASKNNQFVKVEGGLNGLAADVAHLYWSVNGEAPTNPGNDLYLFEPGTKTLTDLTVDPTGNGAEVQGVVAASADGSYLYFVANGDLDGPGKATAGDCHGEGAHGSLYSVSGSCNLYLRHEGTTSFVARLRGEEASEDTDALNWTGTPRELFNTAGYTPKTSFLGKDGQTLLFRSQEKLSEYDNEGVPELYRYRVGEAAIRCVSCPPSGEAVGGGPSLGSIEFPGQLGPPLGSVAMIASRNLSADGNQAFFETAEALSPADTNGQGGCASSTCLDVYEWEAPESGSCKEGAPSYSPLNGGCVYLISTGKDKFPSLFADASESGDDVFFFTRQQLVGQDRDELQDVYDAKVGGGLASQNATAPPPCEGTESCHGAAPAAPVESSPGSAGLLGPANPVAKHKKQKAKKHKAKNNKHKANKHKQKKAHAKGRASR